MCTDTCPFLIENDSTSFEKILLTIVRSHVSCNVSLKTTVWILPIYVHK